MSDCFSSVSRLWVALAVTPLIFHASAAFPERPGALQRFLEGLHAGWNITLFHYRNHGSDTSKVLAGIQVPKQNEAAFDAFLAELGYDYVEETSNEVYKRMLK